MNEYRRTPDSEKCFSLFLQILEYARNRKCLYDGKVRAVLCVVHGDNNERRRRRPKDITQKNHVQGKVCVSRH